MLAASKRPGWLAPFWGALLTLGVLLSGRVARAEGAPGPADRAEPSATLAVLSASVAATIERAVSSEGDEVTASVDQVDDTPWPMIEVPVAPWLAGLCDARGATAIAPLPALPVGDGAVAADESGCEGSALTSGRTVERNDQPAPPPLLEAIDPALAPLWLLLPPTHETHQLPYPPAAQFRLPAGFGRSVDEPPRG